MACELRYLFKFQYHAHYRDLGSEHELCWVYVGQTDAPVLANASEVAAWRFVSPDALDAEMLTNPDHFTPWLKLEWQRLRRQFNAALPPGAACRTRRLLAACCKTRVRGVGTPAVVDVAPPAEVADIRRGRIRSASRLK